MAAFKALHKAQGSGEASPSALLRFSLSSLLHDSCRQRSLEQLEEKTSALKKELVVVKESLNQAILEKEVLENEKEGISHALFKVRMVIVS